jgi:hypothetical protein
MWGSAARRETACALRDATQKSSARIATPPVSNTPDVGSFASNPFATLHPGRHSPTVAAGIFSP